MPLRPMPPEHVRGGGRDPAFAVPQYFVTVRGLRTAVADSGGNGPTIVFLHGLAGNLTHFVHVVPAFAGDFRVVGIDMPGCGESERVDERYSVAMYVDHLRATLDRIGVQRATLVGHSLGGMLATEFALRYRHRVDALVPINPAGFATLPAPVKLAGHAALRPGLLNAVLPRAWKLVLANVFYRDTVTTRRFVDVQEMSYDPATDIADVSRVIADLRYDFLRRNYLDRLEHLDLPVGLVWGEYDRLVPAEAFRSAARRLPNFKHLEIEQCGHMPIIETPERVVHFIRKVIAV